MKTVKEVSRLTGVSVRTLHWYDEIGLLKPAVTTEAGYRLYDDAGLKRLQQILLFRELEFPLKDIKNMVDREDFDRERALKQQLTLLKLKKERLEKIISLTEQLCRTGGYSMDFKAFDRQKLDEYEQRAKETWGGTDAWREYERKTAGASETEQARKTAGLMVLFTEFGALKDGAPDSPEAQAQVKKLQAYITANYYTCTDRILAGLGQMYAAGGEMTDNIDAAGGEGAAVFASRAIAVYCG